MHLLLFLQNTLLKSVKFKITPAISPKINLSFYQPTEEFILLNIEPNSKRNENCVSFKANSDRTVSIYINNVPFCPSDNYSNLEKCKKRKSSWVLIDLGGVFMIQLENKDCSKLCLFTNGKMFSSPGLAPCDKNNDKQFFLITQKNVKLSNKISKQHGKRKLEEKKAVLFGVGDEWRNEREREFMEVINDQMNNVKYKYEITDPDLKLNCKFVHPRAFYAKKYNLAENIKDTELASLPLKSIKEPSKDFCENPEEIENKISKNITQVNEGFSPLKNQEPSDNYTQKDPFSKDSQKNDDKIPLSENDNKIPLSENDNKKPFLENDNEIPLSENDNESESSLKENPEQKNQNSGLENRNTSAIANKKNENIQPQNLNQENDNESQMTQNNGIKPKNEERDLNKGGKSNSGINQKEPFHNTTTSNPLNSKNQQDDLKDENSTKDNENDESQNKKQPKENHKPKLILIFKNNKPKGDILNQELNESISENNKNNSPKEINNKNKNIPQNDDSKNSKAINPSKKNTSSDIKNENMSKNPQKNSSNPNDKKILTKNKDNTNKNKKLNDFSGEPSPTSDKMVSSDTESTLEENNENSSETVPDENTNTYDDSNNNPSLKQQNNEPNYQKNNPSQKQQNNEPNYQKREPKKKCLNDIVLIKIMNELQDPNIKKIKHDKDKKTPVYPLTQQVLKCICGKYKEKRSFKENMIKIKKCLRKIIKNNDVLLPRKRDYTCGQDDLKGSKKNKCSDEKDCSKDSENYMDLQQIKNKNECCYPK